MKRIKISGIGLLMMLAAFITNFQMAHASSPLTGEDIQHFINAIKPLHQLAKKYDIEEEQNDSMQGLMNEDFSPMSHSLSKIKEHQAYGEFKTIINDAGFSSENQWANVGDRVMKSYIALNMQREITPEQKKEMQESMAEIEKNEYLSPEMKKQLLASIQQAMAIVENLSESDKADQEALKPYIPKLERLFEELE